MDLITNIFNEFGLVAVSSLLGFACVLLIGYYRQHQRVLKERIEALKDQVEVHKSMSVMDFVARSNAYKKLAEDEVEAAASKLHQLEEKLERNNEDANKYFDEAQKLKDQIRLLHDQIDESQRIIRELTRENNLAVGNEFVLAVGTFQFSGKPYVAGVVNGIHMHFPVDHIQGILAGVSDNPNDPVSRLPNSDEYVLTLCPEGSFKTTITEEEMLALQQQVRNIDA